MHHTNFMADLSIFTTTHTGHQNSQPKLMPHNYRANTLRVFRNEKKERHIDRER